MFRVVGGSSAVQALKKYAARTMRPRNLVTRTGAALSAANEWDSRVFGVGAALAVAAGTTAMAVSEGTEVPAPKADTSTYSEQSKQVLMLVSMLQQIFVGSLESVPAPDGTKVHGSFKPAGWVRDGGVHGGGVRLQTVDSPVFNRASVNVSAVHYEDIEKYVMHLPYLLYTPAQTQAQAAPPFLLLSRKRAS